MFCDLLGECNGQVWIVFTQEMGMSKIGLPKCIHGMN